MRTVLLCLLAALGAARGRGLDGNIVKDMELLAYQSGAAEAAGVDPARKGNKALLAKEIKVSGNREGHEVDVGIEEKMGLLAEGVDADDARCKPFSIIEGPHCCVLDDDIGEMRPFEDGQSCPPFPFQEYGCYCQEGARVCNNTEKFEKYQERIAAEHLETALQRKQEKKRKEFLAPYVEETPQDKAAIQNFKTLLKETDKGGIAELEPVVTTKSYIKALKEKESRDQLMKIAKAEWDIGRKQPEAYKDKYLEEEFQKNKKRKEDVLKDTAQRQHGHDVERP